MLLNFGGILTPDRLETVLRTVFPRLHEMEERTGHTVPSTLKTGRQRFPRRTSPFAAQQNYEADVELAREDISEEGEPGEPETLPEEEDVILEESALEKKDSESDPHVSEAFLAGWVTKKKECERQAEVCSFPFF